MGEGQGKSVFWPSCQWNGERDEDGRQTYTLPLPCANVNGIFHVDASFNRIVKGYAAEQRTKAIDQLKVDVVQWRAAVGAGRCIEDNQPAESGEALRVGAWLCVSIPEDILEMGKETET